MPYVAGFNVKALTPCAFLHFNICLPTDDNLGNEEPDQEKDKDEKKEEDVDIADKDEEKGKENDKNKDAGEGTYTYGYLHFTSQILGDMRCKSQVLIE